MQYDRFVFGFDQSHVERHGVGRLAVSVVFFRIFIEIFVVERLLDLCGQRVVTSGVLRFAEQFGDPFHGADVVVVDGRRADSVRRELRVRRFAGADIAPVAEAVGDDMAVGFRRQVVYVSSHFVVILFQRAGIAVPLVKVPRDQDVGASPFRSVQETFREDRVLRGDGRDHAVRVLRRRHVADDLRECPRDVVAELHRRSDQVRLFEPSQFLSVRAVGEHARKIAADRPIDQLVNPVKQRVRAGERADRRGGVGRMQTGQFDDFGQSVRVRLAGRNGSFDFYVAETVVGELRLPGFRLAGTERRVAEYIRASRRTLVRGAVAAL